MKIGIWLPFSHAQWVAQMARLAEQSGWDGVFLREEVVGLDRWIPIAAAALSTQTIIIGGLISLASLDNAQPILKEAYRIHRRSGFRLVVCLGSRLEGESPIPDRSSDTRNAPSPVRGPGDDDTVEVWLTQRLVVWRIGLWPQYDSMERSLKHQGLIPVIRDERDAMRAPTRSEFIEIVKFIRQTQQYNQPFELVVEITVEDFNPESLSGQIQAWEAAGATWWVINVAGNAADVKSMKHIEDTIRRGPPAEPGLAAAGT